MQGTPGSTRPAGISSRISRVAGTRHPWTTRGVTVDLPVIVDWVWTDAPTGVELVRIEARVDLVAGQPAVVGMSFASPVGLDLLALQRDFRWSTPLEVVTGLMPELLLDGRDPFEVPLPITGFPAAAMQPLRRQGSLTDEFLTTIAGEYLVRGRGYAASLAREYFVSPRTVISWVEKARARGLLSPPPHRGSAGGHLISRPRP